MRKITVNKTEEILIIKGFLDEVEPDAYCSPEDDEECRLVIPGILLMMAGIPLDSDIDIKCENGRIIISRSKDPLSMPDELLEILMDLDITPNAFENTFRKEGYKYA